jgi:dCTP deaminase
VILSRSQYLAKVAIENGTLEQIRTKQTKDGKEIKIPSYGAGPHSYDMKMDQRVVYVNESKTVNKVLGATERFTLNPGKSATFYSVEKFTFPENTAGLLIGKSTYNRQHIATIVGYFDPGYVGQASIVMHNVGSRAIHFYPGEGIAQMVFYDAQVEGAGEKYSGRWQDPSAVLTTNVKTEIDPRYSTFDKDPFVNATPMPQFPEPAFIDIYDGGGDLGGSPLQSGSLNYPDIRRR